MLGKLPATQSTTTHRETRSKLGRPVTSRKMPLFSGDRVEYSIETLHTGLEAGRRNISKRNVTETVVVIFLLLDNWGLFTKDSMQMS